MLRNKTKAQERRKAVSGTKLNKETKHYMIKENNQKPRNVVFKGTINKRKSMIVLDTGAERNYINTDLYDKLKSKDKTFIGEKTEVLLGNKEKLETIGRTNQLVRFDSMRDIAYEEEFKVVKDLDPTLVFLGIPFLNRQQVIVDFENYLVKIEDRYWKFENLSEKKLSDPEIELYSKVLLIKENDEEEIKLIN